MCMTSYALCLKPASLSALSCVGLGWGHYERGIIRTWQTKTCFLQVDQALHLTTIYLQISSFLFKAAMFSGWYVVSRRHKFQRTTQGVTYLSRDLFGCAEVAARPWVNRISFSLENALLKPGMCDFVTSRLWASYSKD